MRYLLGDLSEDERARMEGAFFTDDSKFEAMRIAEDELVDAYVRNELSSAEQLQFEKNLLSSPRISERVNFARTLAEKINSAQSPDAEVSIEPVPSITSPRTESKTPWWKRTLFTQPAFSMAMAVILVLVAGFVLISGWRLKNESNRIANEQAALQRRQEELDRQSREQRSQSDQRAAELQRARDQLAQDQKRFEDFKRTSETGQRSTLGSIVPFLLTPGGSRGSGEGHDFVIGPEASTAKLELALERNDYARYSVTIENAEEKPVISKSGLKTRNGTSLTLMVPTKMLRPDNYIVTVKGINASGTSEPVANYQFRVLKKN